MYEISEACKAALDSLRVTTRLTGELTLNDGSVFPLTNNDFSQGELSINSRCVSGNDFEYGAVYCAELIASIKTEADRYLFYDGKITVSVEVRLADDSWETIPLGCYNISEADRTGRNVHIKAYDNMILLGEPSDVTQTEIYGTPFEILTVITDMSGIELAQTAEEIETFVNGTAYMGMSVTSEEMTTRDILHDLCAMMCCFAVFDRNGRLQLCRYGKSVVYKAPGRKKKNTKISDYIVEYRGLKAKIRNAYSFYLQEEREGLILDFGSNAFLDLGLEVTKKEMLEAIRDELCTISYTPCSTDLMTGYPALELGDRIEVEDRYHEDVTTYLMSYNWKYRGTHSIKGVGNNPKLRVKSQSDKQMSDMEGAVDLKDVIVHTYTNIKEYTIAEAEQSIITISYTALKDTKPVFIAMVPIKMSLDGEIAFQYYLDGVLMEGTQIVKYLERGQHFVTLSMYLSAEKNSRRTLDVKACCRYFESDIRKQAAENVTIRNFAEAVVNHSAAIQTALNNVTQALADGMELPIAEIDVDIGSIEYEAGAVDTTVPNALIKKEGIKAVLFGQGLAGIATWDGTITVAEEIGRIPINTLDVKIAEAVGVNTQTPKSDTFTEVLGRLPIGSLGIRITESVSVGTEDYTEPSTEEVTE